MSQASNLDLETKLIERTMAQRDEMISKADAESKTLIESSEREVQRVKTEADRQILNIVASVLRGVRDRIVGGVELESRKFLMISREETLQQIFIDAEIILKDMTKDKKKYHEVLVKLIAEAVNAIGGEEFIVAANDADLAEMKKSHRKLESDVVKISGGEVKLTLNSTPIATIGGVVVSNPDGTKIYHNTFEGRIAKARTKLSIQLTKILEA
jgi:V/A-type H+-transporting ATPase subunit E